MLLGKQGQAGELGLTWVEKALAYFQAAGRPGWHRAPAAARGELLRQAPAGWRRRWQTWTPRGTTFSSSGNLRFLVRIDEARALARWRALSRWQQAYEALRPAVQGAECTGPRTGQQAHSARLRVQFDAERTEQQNRELQEENLHRGEALRAAERECRLQAQVIVLGALLLAVLAVLAHAPAGKGAPPASRRR